MLTNDTIVAISSPPGPAPRGIIRLSGPRAWELALTTTTPLPDPPQPNHVYHIHLQKHISLLPAILLLFQAPRSFTGTDIAELHLPGSPALLRMVLDHLIAAGARLAEPGEFTAQAFFHGKLDLTQAEGIAATIAATTHRQLRAAATLREGALHQWTASTAENLADLLALTEAGIDFSDEPGVSFISAPAIRQHLDSLLTQITDLESSALRWERLDQLPTVVLTGLPNVGKSSLINALTGHNRAIVSAIAGTTRDALSATMPSDIGPIRLIDVAGEESSPTEMAAKMNAARHLALHDADLILTIVDSWTEFEKAATHNVQVIMNKADVLKDPPPHPSAQPLLVSAKTGYNLPNLRALIVQSLKQDPTHGSTVMTLNHRHREALAKTREPLLRAAQQSTDDSVIKFPELLAADLRAALDALGEISGTIAPDEILGRVFGTFCVGK